MRPTTRLGAMARLLAVLTLASGALLVSAGTASAANCANAFVPAFAGNSDTHPNTVRGASARIEFVNQVLCAGLAANSGSFSSYWVAVFNAAGQARNIFQVGVDKCRGLACPSGVPVNTPYYFWAYGREPGGPCGNAVSPSPRLASAGLAGAGTPLFTVIRQFLPGEGNFYIAKISGATQVEIAATSLETCWGSVDHAQIFNETGDPGDQSGGPVGNKQNFEDPLWHNGSAWQPINRPAGADCDARERASMRCQWAANGSDVWWSWDTRFP